MPNQISPQDANASHVVELSPIIKSSSRQFTRDQHEDTTDATTDVHLVRADTEQRLGVDQDRAHDQPLHSSDVITQDVPARGRQDDNFMSEGLTMWRAHHQDLYSSKWFKSLEFSIIVYVLLVALIVFVLISPLVNADLFSSRATFGSAFITPITFLSPVFFFLCLVFGGIRWSKGFR